MKLYIIRFILTIGLVLTNIASCTLNAASDDFDDLYASLFSEQPSSLDKDSKNKKPTVKPIDPALNKSIYTFLQAIKTLQQEINSTENALFYPSEREQCKPFFVISDKVRVALSHFGKSEHHKGKKLYLDVLMEKKFDSIRSKIDQIGSMLNKLIKEINGIKEIFANNTYDPDLTLTVPKKLKAAIDRKKNIISQLAKLCTEDKDKKNEFSEFAQGLENVIKSPEAAQSKKERLENAKKLRSSRNSQSRSRGSGYGSYGSGSGSYRGSSRDYGYDGYSSSYNGSGGYGSSYGGYGSYGSSSGYGSYGRSYGDDGDYDKNISENSTGSGSGEAKSHIAIPQSEEKTKTTESADSSDNLDGLIKKMGSHDITKQLQTISALKTVTEKTLESMSTVYENPQCESYLRLVKKILFNLSSPETTITKTDDDKSKPNKEISPKPDNKKAGIDKINAILPALLFLKMHPVTIVSTYATTQTVLAYAHKPIKKYQSSITNNKNLIVRIIEDSNYIPEIKNLDKLEEEQEKRLMDFEKERIKKVLADIQTIKKVADDFSQDLNQKVNHTQTTVTKSFTLKILQDLDKVTTIIAQLFKNPTIKTMKAVEHNNPPSLDKLLTSTFWFLTAFDIKNSLVDEINDLIDKLNMPTTPSAKSPRKMSDNEKILLICKNMKKNFVIFQNWNIDFGSKKEQKNLNADSNLEHNIKITIKEIKQSAPYAKHQGQVPPASALYLDHPPTETNHDEIPDEKTLQDAARTLDIRLNELTHKSLKKGFYKLALKFHPDKFATKPAEERKTAEEQFKIINNAKETLKKYLEQREKKMKTDAKK